MALTPPDTVVRIGEMLGTTEIFPAVEGGWFIPTFRVDRGKYQVPDKPPPEGEPGINPGVASTGPASGGYYVLLPGELGALPTLKCDELYVFVAGNPVEVLQIGPAGHLRREVVGPLGAG